MGDVIEIQFFEDLSIDKDPKLGNLLNEMRDRMIMGVWRKQWYKAQKEEDWDEMILLDEKMKFAQREGTLNLEGLL